MEELKKYIIEGQVQDELISEMDETTKPSIKENYYMEYKAKKLVESVLREFDMAVMAQPTVSEDPYKNVDPKVKKSQQLVRVLQDNLYKLCNAQMNPRPGEELDSDIKALMQSNLEPTIKLIINKLHSLWFGEQKTQEQDQEKVVVIGQEVITPQQESYIIKQINGEKIVLEGITGTKIVEKVILEKWLKE